MLPIMRVFLSFGERPRDSRPPYRVLTWLFVLAMGMAIPALAFPGQAQQPPPQGTPVAQPEQGGQGENSTDQGSPESSQDAAASEPDQSSESNGQDDEMLTGIRSVLANLSSPSLGLLGQAFQTVVKPAAKPPNESAAVELVELGDLDGDGVPEVLLNLLDAKAGAEAEEQGQSSPTPWRVFYLLSWDGSRWKVSTLSPSARNLQFSVVRLGKTGRGIALVNFVGEEAFPYPAIFEVRDHEAAPLWDSQLGTSRYNALRHGHIAFQDDPKLDQTVMVLTGQADPGLLQFEPGGHRGFAARCVYRWDGQAYVPAGRTEYESGPDNSLYRFIAALHMRDYRGAYALVDPSKFLTTDEPSLEKFRQTIEQTWPEFLDNQVFQAREASAGSPDALAFELPEKHLVYRPKLSNDGRFLLTGLEREIETGPAGNSP